MTSGVAKPRARWGRRGGSTTESEVATATRAKALAVCTTPRFQNRDETLSQEYGELADPFGSLSRAVSPGRDDQPVAGNAAAGRCSTLHKVELVGCVIRNENTQVLSGRHCREAIWIFLVGTRDRKPDLDVVRWCASDVAHRQRERNSAAVAGVAGTSANEFSGLASKRGLGLSFDLKPQEPEFLFTSPLFPRELILAICRFLPKILARSEVAIDRPREGESGDDEGADRDAGHGRLLDRWRKNVAACDTRAEVRGQVLHLLAVSGLVLQFNEGVDEWLPFLRVELDERVVREAVPDAVREPGAAAAIEDGCEGLGVVSVQAERLRRVHVEVHDRHGEKSTT
jgi:hypothetical protein